VPLFIGQQLELQIVKVSLRGPAVSPALRSSFRSDWISDAPGYSRSRTAMREWESEAIIE